MTNPLLAFKRAAGKTSIIAAEIEACRLVDAVACGLCEEACQECLRKVYAGADPRRHMDAIAEIIRRGGRDYPRETREQAVGFFLASLESEAIDTPEVLPGNGVGKQGKPRI